MPRVKERNQSNSKSIRANFLDKIKSKLLMSDKVLSGCRETFRKQVPKKDRFYLSVFLFLAHFLLFSARYNLVSDVTLVLSNFSAANLSMRWKSYRKKLSVRKITVFLSQCFCLKMMALVGQVSKLNTSLFSRVVWNTTEGPMLWNFF